MDCQAVQPVDKSPPRAYLLGNAESSVGSPTSWNLGKQVTMQAPCPHGYYECKQMPGLWKHTSRPISFTLVVDDFGVKYTNQEDVKHLIGSLKKDYELTKDWDGNLYCRIKLKWDYS